MNQDDQQSDDEFEKPRISRRVILFSKPHPRIEIGKNEHLYSLLIKLPGIPRNYRELKLEVEQDGDISLKGLVTDSEIWNQLIREYEYVLDGPATGGRFYLAMDLPGPVDPRLTELNFKPDGNLVVFFRQHALTRRSIWADQ